METIEAVMRAILKHKTKAGTFFIARSDDGRFHPVFHEESLGSYSSISQAIDDLTQNVTFSVLHPETTELLDTSELGIPEDPDDWESC